MSDNKDLDEAIRRLETKHRVESFLVKIGASAEAAALIAASPNVNKDFMWDGVNLTMRGSDLAASEDQQAIDHFTKGPLAALFAKPVTDKAKDEPPPLDDALVAAAKAGNRTAYSKLARDSFNGDVKALDAALADKGTAAAPDLNGYGGANNPFMKLRRADGTIDKAIEARVGDMIKAMGHKKVADIARAAKSPDAPIGRSLTGLPLRP